MASSSRYREDDGYGTSRDTSAVHRENTHRGEMSSRASFDDHPMTADAARNRVQQYRERYTVDDGRYRERYSEDDGRYRERYSEDGGRHRERYTVDDGRYHERYSEDGGRHRERYSDRDVDPEDAPHERGWFPGISKYERSVATPLGLGAENTS